MTTEDAQGNLHRGKGSRDGGQFDKKQNAAPKGGLTPPPAEPRRLGDLADRQAIARLLDLAHDAQNTVSAARNGGRDGTPAKVRDALEALATAVQGLDHVHRGWAEAAAAEAAEADCSRCGGSFLVEELQTIDGELVCFDCSVRVECPECGEWVASEDLNHWPDLKPPVSMCSSCTHNAYRSGWDPEDEG